MKYQRCAAAGLFGLAATLSFPGAALAQMDALRDTLRKENMQVKALHDQPRKDPPVSEGGTFSFTLENDIFGNADKDYTNGVRFDYITPRNDLPRLGRLARDNLGWLTAADDWYMIFALGQNMFTPSDITDPTPPREERPYAGFLYGSIGVAADRGDRLDTIALDVGLIGPLSGAEYTQKYIHDLFGYDKPVGWDEQLENEPAFRLLYERKYRYGYEVETPLWELGFDAAPHANLSLGTVDTSAGLGFTIRFGQDLADDYGPPRVRPAVGAPGFFRSDDGFGWYLFAGAEGRAVGRNLFLEGNTFGPGRDGVSVNRLQGDIQAGLSLRLWDVEVSYTHVLRTEEYKAQDGFAEFGSVNLRTKF